MNIFISQQTHLYVLQSDSMGSWYQNNSLYSGHRACACAVSDPDLEIREGSPNFFRPFGLQFGQKITKGPSPPSPPLDPSLMWTGIRSPSQCWRGGSVLWTIFIEIKKIYNLKLNYVFERNHLSVYFLFILKYVI